MNEKQIGDVKGMTKETIPKEALVVGRTVTANVMKYCLDNGSEKGIKSTVPIIMVVDGKTMKCGEVLRVLVAKDTEIELIQE